MSAKEDAEANHGKRKEKAYDHNDDPDMGVQTDHRYRVEAFPFFFIHRWRLFNWSVAYHSGETPTKS